MRTKNNREALIKTATNLFYEVGFTEASIRDISSELNINIASIYHYFKNKDDLLFIIIESIGNDLLNILEKAIEEFEDPLDQLSEMLFRHICCIKDKKKEVKIYVEEQHHLPPKLRKIIYRQHRKIYEVYLNQFKKLKKGGRLRIDHLQTINFAMFGMVNWCYRWYREDGELSIEELANKIIDMFFGGVLKKEVN
jgi:AcrR family transcriptional regulator